MNLIGWVESLFIKRPVGFASNVLKLVSGTVIAQALTILTAPVLSRLFPPQAFGTTSVFISIASVLAVIICLRYEQSILLPKDDADAANLFSVSLIISLVISLLVAIILVGQAGTVTTLLNVPELTAYLWILPIALVFQGLFQAINQWNTRQKKFTRLSLARVAASLTTSIVPIFLALMGYRNAAGLIISWITGTIIFSLVLSAQVLREDAQILFHKIRPTSMLAVARRYWKFPLLDTWGSLINTLSWQLPSLLLSPFFSQSVVGYYAMASRILLLPMTIIGNAISQVFFQHASEKTANQESLAQVVSKVFDRLVAITLVPVLLLAILGKELFTVILGAQWAEAGIYAQILAPWIFFLFISSPLSTLFSILERQETALIVHIAILSTRFASLLIGGLIKNVYLALALWSASGVIVYGGLALWNLKITGVPLNHSLRTLGKYLLAGSPIAALLITMNYFLPIADIWVLLTAAIASLLYVIWILKTTPEIQQSLGIPAKSKATGLDAANHQDQDISNGR